MEETSLTKKIIITLYVLLIAICIGIDLWYYLIVMYAPEKTVIDTYNVSDLTLSSGEKEKIMKIKYFSNKNHNGLEMFEIQLNAFTDENKDSYYSNGLQFVTNTVDEKLDWEYQADSSTQARYRETGNWFSGYNAYYETYGSYKPNEISASTYNYGAIKDNPFGQSTNPITEKSVFRIEIDGEIYGMRFRGTEIGREKKYGTTQKHIPFYGWSANGAQGYFEYYESASVYNFSYLLYNYVQSIPGGTAQNIEFQFGDWFDYLKFDGSSYKPSTDREEYAKKVTTFVVNNYSIQVEVSDDGARLASDSLFGVIHGDGNYRGDDDVYEDYLYGENLIKVDIWDFDLIQVADEYVDLKLKKSFVNAYSQFAQQSKLVVEIDLDKLEAQGYKFHSIDKDSLKPFTVSEIYTTRSGEQKEVIQ